MNGFLYSHYSAVHFLIAICYYYTNTYMGNL